MNRNSFNSLENIVTPYNVIILICVLAYLSQFIGIDLVSAGVKDNMAIKAGQWYRLLSSVFLHLDLAHLALNMVSLYSLAPITVKLFDIFKQNGNLSFLTVFFVSGLMGSLASYYFNPNPSLGASGAIFGLMGALLTIAYFKQLPDLYKEFSSVLLANLVIGFLIPRIDVSAHLGGLVGGALTAYLLITF
jgi:rhomboid protease GluP